MIESKRINRVYGVNNHVDRSAILRLEMANGSITYSEVKGTVPPVIIFRSLPKLIPRFVIHQPSKIFELGRISLHWERKDFHIRIPE